MKTAMLGILLLAGIPSVSYAASAQESLTANVISHHCPSVDERSAQRLEQNYYKVNRLKRAWIGTLYFGTAAEDPDRIANYCKEIEDTIENMGY